MSTALAILEQNKPTLTQLVLVNMPPGTNPHEAELLAMREIANMELIMSTSPDLAACSANSILLAVKQCINDNLTLAPSASLVYLYPRKVTVGTDSSNQPIKEWVICYDPTANGRLSIARQAGSILDYKNPVYTFDTAGTLDTVTVEFLVPSIPSPRWQDVTFDKRSFEKWGEAAAAKSASKTKPKHYTSYKGGIDPEFAGTKAIRHGLAKRGTNMNERKNPALANAYRPIPKEMALNEAHEDSGFHIIDATATVDIDTETGEIVITSDLNLDAL